MQYMFLIYHTPESEPTYGTPEFQAMMAGFNAFTAQGDTVLVVGGDGKTGQRSVRIGGQQGGQWVVLDGLQAGEQVVVDGFQKLRGNPVVKPVPWQPAGQKKAPASSPAPAASAASAAR